MAKRVILLFVLTIMVATAVWALPQTYPCPYDGEDADLKTWKSDGTNKTCEYSHVFRDPKNNYAPTPHTFWVPCSD